MKSLIKTVFAVLLVLGAVAAARADMGAFSLPDPAGPGVVPSAPVCDQANAGTRASLRPTDGLPLDLAGLPLSTGAATMVDETSKPASRLPEEPASLSLVLVGLGSLGAWHIGRAAKNAHLGHVPDWFHADGPLQIGHTFAANPDCTAVLEICSFAPPVGDHTLLHRLRCDAPPIHQPQCILVTESPRGPPLLFC